MASSYDDDDNNVAESGQCKSLDCYSDENDSNSGPIHTSTNDNNRLDNRNNPLDPLRHQSLSNVPPRPLLLEHSSSCLDVSSLSSYALGLVFIVIVSVIWSVASIVVQYLYKEQDFDAPFLLTYIGTSLFTVLLLFPYYNNAPTAVANDVGEVQSLGNYQQVAVAEDDHFVDDGQDHHHSTSEERTTHPNDPILNSSSKLWTDYDHRIAAAKIAPVWFISNFAYNASLRYTSITSSTILVNTGSLFTFLFALLTKDEHFNVCKLLGVLCGMSGCILTGLNDAKSSRASGDDNGNHNTVRFLLQIIPLDRILPQSQQEHPDDNGDDNKPVWGDVLSLGSALFYGVYAVMVRVLCPHDESLMSMKRFLGYIGLWNMLALSPIVIWQVGNGAATLSAFVFVCLIGKGLFDNVLSDYLWARAVVLTSATVATVGLGLTIPLAFLSDVALGRPEVMNVKSVVGAIAVLTGFVLVNVGQQKDNEGDSEAQQQPLSSASSRQYHHHPSDINAGDSREQGISSRVNASGDSLQQQWLRRHQPVQQHQHPMNVELQVETR